MTGAGGFLGSKVRLRIQRSGAASIVAVSESGRDFKLGNRMSVSDMPTIGPFDNDVLVLCGAHYYKGDDPSQIASMQSYNCAYTRLVLDQFVNNRGRKIIYFSSFMQLFCRNKRPYAGWYVQTKQDMLDYARNDPRVKLLNLYIYDTWARDDDRPKFLPTLIDALSRGQTFNIPSPDTLMDLCDADSVADAVAFFCNTFDEGSLALCTGMPMTLREIAESAVSSLGLQGGLTFGDVAPYFSCLPYVDVKPGIIKAAQFVL